MNSISIAEDGQREIAAIVDAWAEATRQNDLDAIMAFHDPGVRTFDCHSVFEFRGAEPYRQFYAACLACMQGGMTFDIDGLDIEVEGNLAFAHFMVRCGATGTDGTRHLGRLRSTLCFRRVGGDWRIVHAHCSAPFDPMTEKTMFGEASEGAEAGAA